MKILNRHGAVVGGARRSRALVKGLWHHISAHPDPWSYAIWVTVTLVFAGWTALHFHPSSGPAWLGMTVRSGAFAAGTLVVREWFALRWELQWGDE